MGFGDYFKGPQHKAEATRLEAEIQTLKKRSQFDLQTLQGKYDQLEAKAQEIGLLDLLIVQTKIRDEQSLLDAAKIQVAATMAELQATRTQLHEVQKQILVAEEAVELESFSLYHPKYQFTNSAEYKVRLDAIREVQKQTARGLSAEVDAWDNQAVQLTKAEWKKLRKDALKLALRSFNSESEYCVDNVKFNNIEKMEERIRKSFETCNKLLKNVGAWWKDVVLEDKLQELYLAHEYQIKRQEEKESARQAREDQREQEKLEREIREARAKIDKERRHFTSALQKLQLRLTAAVDRQERDDLQTRIDEIDQPKQQAG